MRKYKFFPFYIFIGLLTIGILKIKLIGPGGRGNYFPTEPLTWTEIIDNLPRYTIGSLIMSLIFFFIYKMLLKDEMRVQEEAKRVNEKKVYSASNSHECRICGYYVNDFPWGEDGKSPSFQICSCCGVQFGREDDTLESIKEYRAGWISKGGKWFVKNETPEGWNIEAQMKNIPNEFNGERG